MSEGDSTLSLLAPQWIKKSTANSRSVGDYQSAWFGAGDAASSSKSSAYDKPVLNGNTRKSDYFADSSISEQPWKPLPSSPFTAGTALPARPHADASTEQLRPGWASSGALAASASSGHTSAKSNGYLRTSLGSTEHRSLFGAELIHTARGPLSSEQGPVRPAGLQHDSTTPNRQQSSSVYRKVVFEKEYPSLKDARHPLGYAPKEAPYKQNFLASRNTTNWTSKLADAPQHTETAPAPAAKPAQSLLTSVPAYTSAKSSDVAAAVTPPVQQSGWSSIASSSSSSLASATAGFGGRSGESMATGTDKLREQLAVRQSKQLVPVLAKKDDASKGRQSSARTLLGSAAPISKAVSLSAVEGSKLCAGSVVISNGTITLTKKMSAPLDKPLTMSRASSAAASRTVKATPQPLRSSKGTPGSSELPPVSEAHDSIEQSPPRDTCHQQGAEQDTSPAKAGNRVQSVESTGQRAEVQDAWDQQEEEPLPDSLQGREQGEERKEGNDEHLASTGQQQEPATPAEHVVQQSAGQQQQQQVEREPEPATVEQQEEEPQGFEEPEEQAQEAADEAELLRSCLPDDLLACEEPAAPAQPVAPLWGAPVPASNGGDLDWCRQQPQQHVPYVHAPALATSHYMLHSAAPMVMQQQQQLPMPGIAALPSPPVPLLYPAQYPSTPAPLEPATPVYHVYHGASGSAGAADAQSSAPKFQVPAEEEAFLRSLGWTDADDGTDDVLTEEEIQAFKQQQHQQQHQHQHQQQVQMHYGHHAHHAHAHHMQQQQQQQHLTQQQYHMQQQYQMAAMQYGAPPPPPGMYPAMRMGPPLQHAAPASPAKGLRPYM